MSDDRTYGMPHEAFCQRCGRSVGTFVPDGNELCEKCELEDLAEEFDEQIEQAAAVDPDHGLDDVDLDEENERRADENFAEPSYEGDDA